MSIAPPAECPDRGQATPAILAFPSRETNIERMAKAMFMLRPRIPGWKWDDQSEALRQHYLDFATAAYDAL